MKRKTAKLFVKSQVSAQVATLVDFTSTFVCMEWFGMYYMIAATLGPVLGGLTNCGINYKWTFQVTNSKFQYVLLKYFLVWFGSLLLNVGGVYLLKNFLQDYTTLWTTSHSACVMVAKVIVAIFIAVVYNFNMHRLFVFKDKELIE